MKSFTQRAMKKREGIVSVNPKYLRYGIFDHLDCSSELRFVFSGLEPQNDVGISLDATRNGHNLNNKAGLLVLYDAPIVSKGGDSHSK